MIRDIEVGHIYRKRFPYKVAVDEPMYNRMLIASMLLPDELKERVFDSCRRQNEMVFREMLALLAENSDKVEELRRYYISISHRDFNFIREMNRE